MTNDERRTTVGGGGGGGGGVAANERANMRTGERANDERRTATTVATGSQ